MASTYVGLLSASTTFTCVAFDPYVNITFTSRCASTLCSLRIFRVTPIDDRPRPLKWPQRLTLLRPPVLIGSATLLVGMAVYIAWLSAGPVVGIVLAIAAGGLLLGFVASRGRSGSNRLDASYLEIFEVSPLPSYLVATDGRIEAHNAAARRQAPVGQQLKDVLAGAFPDQDADLYRLGRRADAAGYATQRVKLDGSDWTLSAEPFGRGRQVWRLHRGPLEGFAPPPHVEAPKGETSAVVASARARWTAYSPDTMLEGLPVALSRLDGQGNILFANRAARRLLGEDSVEGRQIASFLEGLGKPMSSRIIDTMAGKAQGRSEVARGLRQGIEGFLQVTMTRMESPDGPTVLAVLSDATELKTLEAQFVQSQKMQAVGQLAGGIAHDFNNLLTAINGHCDLLLLRHLQGDGDHSDLIQIRQNANRAAALVRQLLAFSRKQTLRPQVLHLYDTLAELANLLNRLLGEKVALEINNSEDIWPVRVDERQLEQVIVNLVVNARDAMPTGGVVTLATEKRTLSEPLERDRAIVPAGEYSVVKVSDSGIGIPPDRLAKIFEPFFTTKKVGEGTGLGLSTAYGIIKQMDGFIFVDSTPGEGSVFSIYLPAHESTGTAVEVGPQKEAAAVPPKTMAGHGVILLAEDEAPVRAFAVRALQMRGYTVLEADCGERALEILEDETVEVNMFVSDVVMPGVDGPTWVAEALKKRPNVSTVFMSGYSQDTFVDGRVEIPRSTYLAKPFTLNDLIEQVRDHMEKYGP